MFPRQILVTLVTLSLSLPLTASAQTYSGYGGRHGYPTIEPSGPPSIVFPVQGGATYSDDFGDARSGGRLHEGNDLMAPKMTPILAARGGRVTFAPTTEPTYGFTINIAGDDGYEYDYLHINNDTPGTDDGLGGAAYSYAPGIGPGVQVRQGQFIAYVGDSGNAESTGSHLHFEIRLPDGTAIDPFPYLTAAQLGGAYDKAAALAASPTINADLSLTADPAAEATCTSGTLIRTAASKSVYYCGADGRRYVFPNASTYATWYADFSTVKIISDEALASARLGGNVTYRPGVKLIKITTDPKVYAVAVHGTLRWIASPAVAAKYYGTAWAKSVSDVPDVFFLNYKIGEAVSL
jgi:hypothetical protein